MKPKTFISILAIMSNTMLHLVSFGASDLIVVTHGTVMSLYVSQELGIEPLSFWRGLATPCALVTTRDKIETLDALESLRISSLEDSLW
jgi:hypothetical protein